MSLPDRSIWTECLRRERFHLWGGLPRTEIQPVNQEFGICLPEDYCDFLLVSNGMRIDVRLGYIELHPLVSENVREATVASVNRSIDEYDPQNPLFVIGVEVEEGIGYLRDELRHQKASLPLYRFIHDQGDYYVTANSIPEYICDLAELGPDDDYHPAWFRAKMAQDRERPIRNPWWRFWG